MDFDDLDEQTGGRLYDITIYGATGYSGCLMVEYLDYLISESRIPPKKWAIAGRNKHKLEKIKSKCKTDPSVIEVTSTETMEEMAELTSVVVTACGPYILHGEAVVAACVAKKTHYVDITGEIVWMRRMIDKYHEDAREKGIMIVNSCGYMCAPEDVSLSILAKKLGSIRKCVVYQWGYAPTAGGGSFLSGYAGYEDMTGKELNCFLDPFSLGGKRNCGDRAEDKDPREVTKCAWYPNIFLTVGHSTATSGRILRRTCELFEKDAEAGMDALQYGGEIVCHHRDVHLNEGAAKQRQNTNMEPTEIKGLIKHAATMSKALGKGMIAPPGYGAVEKARSHGFMEQFIIAEGENGDFAHAYITNTEAYEITAVLAVIGALVILDEGDIINVKERGGVITPGYAFYGSSFVERVVNEPWKGMPGRKVAWDIKDGKPEKGTVERLISQSDKNAAEFGKKMGSGAIEGIVSLPELLM